MLSSVLGQVLSPPVWALGEDARQQETKQNTGPWNPFKTPEPRDECGKLNVGVPETGASEVP